MVRKLLVSACVALATIGFAGDERLLTPRASATVLSPWRGAVTAEGPHREVLTGVRITVHRGGQAGRFRLRVTGNFVSPWYTLPATPGRYTFPAPRIYWDDRDGIIAIEQKAGALAILEPVRCYPDIDNDPCKYVSVDGGGVHLPGYRLAVSPISEPDPDGDLVPTSEDRTDLRVHARRAGRRLDVTIANRGPRTADAPALFVASRAAWGWDRTCAIQERERSVMIDPDAAPWDRSYQCDLAPLAAGETRQLHLRLPRSARGVWVQVASEGKDLQPSDNAARTAGATSVP